MFTTPFLRTALESPNPLHVEFVAGKTIPLLGPLIGMHSAVWIPLRERGRTFGVAMVGYAGPPGSLDLDALRARADEITLALQHYRDSRQSELAAEERRTQLRLSRAILCGVSADFDPSADCSRGPALLARGIYRTGPGERTPDELGKAGKARKGGLQPGIKKDFCKFGAVF